MITLHLYVFEDYGAAVYPVTCALAMCRNSSGMSYGFFHYAIYGHGTSWSSHNSISRPMAAAESSIGMRIPWQPP